MFWNGVWGCLVDFGSIAFTASWVFGVGGMFVLVVSHGRAVGTLFRCRLLEYMHSAASALSIFVFSLWWLIED